MDEINILTLANALDYVPSLNEFIDIYKATLFYYVRNGRKFYISLAEAYLVLSGKYAPC